MPSAFAIITLLVGLMLIVCLDALGSLQTAGSRGIARCALTSYIVTLLYITVFSRMPVKEIRLQLIPFFEFNRIKGIGFVENMILFVPSGALLLLSFPLRARRGFVFGFCLSLCVETIQYVTHRGVTDIDDLIANTLGAVLGTLFFMGVQKLNQALFPPENA